MYYIINHTDHIIAADSQLLNLLSLTSMDELQKNIALGDIEFASILDTVLDITLFGETQTYTSVHHTMAGLMGEITLVEVIVEKEQHSEEALSVAEPDTTEAYTQEEIEDETDEEIFTLLEEEEIQEITETSDGVQEETEIDEDELFDILEEPLTLQEEGNENVLEEETHAAISDYHDDTPIKINAEVISKEIGISEEDYERFLKEYIETAFTLEDDLKSSKEHPKRHAITTLFHLSHVLHLPMVTEQIKEVQECTPEVEAESIKALYNTLARLDTSKEETLSVDTSSQAIESSDYDHSDNQSFGDIDLSTVAPIHFDFQPDACAEELSLPVELIEEFISDFIDLAHLETAKMLEAYRRGDLTTIQKIGHLLKGTSSNLRITALSETLYAIQFCEESDELEELIKTYWGHFLSFENQFNLKMQRN